LLGPHLGLLLGVAMLIRQQDAALGIVVAIEAGRDDDSYSRPSKTATDHSGYRHRVRRRQTRVRH
jgi:hypothetical protein